MTANGAREVIDVMSKAQWDTLLKGKAMMIIHFLTFPEQVYLWPGMRHAHAIEPLSIGGK